MAESLLAAQPRLHCFREDNCADHPYHDGPACCCCGYEAEAHEGCDCHVPGVTYRGLFRR